ncbi:uncharacterized protein LOC135115936 isoform X4 [Scylla paramamosain]|uniref:uncharacterized protein LOC135115936 isoform X4 n=1 Tax=Scylla paramamosain TaxID=85552 RepID=UPI003083A1DF
MNGVGRTQTNVRRAACGSARHLHLQRPRRGRRDEDTLETASLWSSPSPGSPLRSVAEVRDSLRWQRGRHLERGFEE